MTKHFQVIENNYWVHQDTDLPSTKILPPGTYSWHTTMVGSYFHPETPKADGIIDPQDSIVTEILNDIKTFFSPKVEQRFKDYKFIYKRGILMHGLPGTGKTVTIQRLMKMAIEAGYVCLISVHPHHCADALKAIKSVSGSEQKILVIWEEIDIYLGGYENVILQLLDGMEQIPGVVYVATTNYINRIPTRLKARPSRFARVIEVLPPNAYVRREFLRAKIIPGDLDSIDLEDWVAKTEGLVIDQINELIKSVLILGCPLDTTIETLKRYPLDPDMLGDEDEDDEDDDD